MRGAEEIHVQLIYMYEVLFDNDSHFPQFCFAPAAKAK